MARNNSKAVRRARAALKQVPLEQVVCTKELLGPTPQQMAKGNVRSLFVTHADSWTTAKAHKVSNVLDQWFEQGHVGFEEPARNAIEWCQVRWEARGTIGNLSANYSPTCGSGGGGNAMGGMELVDELDRQKARFPRPHWDTFENVCRWGQPAGTAGSEFAANNPQALASARAIVGLIANMIADELRL